MRITAPRLRRTPIAAAVTLATALAGLAAGPAIAELETGTKLKLSGFGEGERDLGIEPQPVLPDTDTDADADDTLEGYADAEFTVHWFDGDRWGAYLRAQGFLTTDEITVTDEDQARKTESYAALREFWVEYGGLTAYPGEKLRLGRQRVREADGLWWDQDIEALRWLFDTTLLRGQIGIAEAFSTYRTSDHEPSLTLRDRAYGFGSLDWQWTPGQFAGARVAHAFDHKDLDLDDLAVDGSVGPDAETRKDQLTWLGVHLHNNYFTDAQQPGLAYWLEATYLFGDREQLQAADLLQPAAVLTRDVRSWATDAGLRWRLPLSVPLQLGLAYAHGDGGGGYGGTSNQFEQTGLQSNRSRYTGTRSLLYRYGEALQPELSNLEVTSAFVSLPFDRYDASLAYHHYRRDDTRQGITTKGLDVQPGSNGRAIGDGVDLVLTRFFDAKPAQSVDEADDLRSNVRLRAGLFDPGKAYGDDARKDQYRVTLEMTLWF